MKIQQIWRWLEKVRSFHKNGLNQIIEQERFISFEGFISLEEFIRTPVRLRGMIEYQLGVSTTIL